MALAVLACLGSLLGWQFTIAQTGKSAADERMFPAFFAKVNRMGAPVTGMVVMGVVQSLLALIDDLAQPERAVQRARQPGGRHQRDSLHHRALGAAGDDEAAPASSSASTASTWRSPGRDAVQHVRASIASGKDAVLGGMLVMAIGFIIWGFIAPRFTRTRPTADGGGA